MNNIYNRIMALLVMFSLLIAFPLQADTVILRNGKQYRNVKTRVVKKRIYITLENGRTLNFSAAQVKSVVPASVDWKKPEKKEPAKKPQPVIKKEPVSRPEPEIVQDSEGSFFHNPYAMGAQSLVPGWSGLFLSDSWQYGVVLSILELAAVVEYTRYSPSPVKEADQYRFLPSLPDDPDGAGPAPPRPIDDNIFFKTYLVLLSNNRVVSPDGGYTSESSYLDHRKIALGALVGFLVIDAIASYLVGYHEAQTDKVSGQIDYFFDANLTRNINPSVSDTNDSSNYYRSETEAKFGIHLYF